MRGPIGRLAFHRPIENPRLKLGRKLGRRLPGVTAEKSGQSLGRETLTPTRNEIVVAGQFVAQLGPRMPGFKQQYQPRKSFRNTAAGMSVVS